MRSELFFSQNSENRTQKGQGLDEAGAGGTFLSKTFGGWWEERPPGRAADLPVREKRKQ